MSDTPPPNGAPTTANGEPIIDSTHVRPPEPPIVALAKRQEVSMEAYETVYKTAQFHARLGRRLREAGTLEDGVIGRLSMRIQSAERDLADVEQTLTNGKDEDGNPLTYDQKQDLTNVKLRLLTLLNSSDKTLVTTARGVSNNGSGGKRKHKNAAPTFVNTEIVEGAAAAPSPI